MTHLEAITILEKIDHTTVIDSDWWDCFSDNMDIPDAIFKLTGLNNWQLVLNKYEGYLMFELLEEIKPFFEDELCDSIEQAKQTLIDAGYFGITWTLPNIVESAKSCGYLIDEKQAREIADSIDNNHDCNIGINWENIHFHIREFAEEKSLPEFEFIEFEGESYPSREIDLGDNNIVTIASASLQKALEGGEDGFKDFEAEQIDYSIYFYVEDHEIGLPTDELVLVVIEGII